GPRQLLGFTQSRRRRPGFVTIYTKTRSIYRFPVLKPLRLRTNTTYTNKTNIQVTKTRRNPLTGRCTVATTNCRLQFSRSVTDSHQAPLRVFAPSWSDARFFPWRC